jgi:hypothetical protein
MADTSTENKKQSKIQADATHAYELERAMGDIERELMANETFQRFLQLQKQLPELWKQVESAMIDNDIKKISGEWGSLTIVERLSWEIDWDKLPTKYFKKAVDSAAISRDFRLMGKSPKGASPRYTKFLRKDLK